MRRFGDSLKRTVLSWLRGLGRQTMTYEFDIGDVVVKIGSTGKWIVSGVAPNGLYALRAEDWTRYICVYCAEAHLDWVKVGTWDYITARESDHDL